MSAKAPGPLLGRVLSVRVIWLIAFLSGLFVFALSIVLQWFVYHDWMHRHGPLRFIGSVLAFALAFVFVFRWRCVVRQHQLEILRRLEQIRWMNDRIRNSLQTIECLTYCRDPHATDPVRSAIDAIESVLQEVAAESLPSPTLTTLDPSYEKDPLARLPSPSPPRP